MSASLPLSLDLDSGNKQQFYSWEGGILGGRGGMSLRGEAALGWAVTGGGTGAVGIGEGASSTVKGSSLGTFKVWRSGVGSFGVGSSGVGSSGAGSSGVGNSGVGKAADWSADWISATIVLGRSARGMSAD